MLATGGLTAYIFSRLFKAARWVAMFQRPWGLIFIGVGMHLQDAHFGSGISSPARVWHP